MRQTPANLTLAETILAAATGDAELAAELAFPFLVEVLADKETLSVDEVRGWVKEHLLRVAEAMNEARTLRAVQELGRGVRKQIRDLEKGEAVGY